MTQKAVVNSPKKRRKISGYEIPLHLMLIPGIIIIFIFHYVPLGGLIIAFQRFIPAKGLFGSQKWVGLQNFQYIFSPEWSVIDTLPASIFQGIPGLDMSMRLERYYRVNMTPYFISERTPSEGREDLWELLEAVGLDYYDRFEWLLRTNMRCGTDNLIVERADAAQN